MTKKTKKIIIATVAVVVMAGLAVGGWDRVVAQQTLHVDTVSGATNSSLVILSAIQNALESGVN